MNIVRVSLDMLRLLKERCKKTKNPRFYFLHFHSSCACVAPILHMGKRKSAKPPPKRIISKVPTIFDCPFCENVKVVQVKLYVVSKSSLKTKLLWFQSCFCPLFFSFFLSLRNIIFVFQYSENQNEFTKLTFPVMLHQEKA